MRARETPLPPNGSLGRAAACVLECHSSAIDPTLAVCGNEGAYNHGKTPFADAIAAPCFASAPTHAQLSPSIPVGASFGPRTAGSGRAFPAQDLRCSLVALSARGRWRAGWAGSISHTSSPRSRVGPSPQRREGGELPDPSPYMGMSQFQRTRAFFVQTGSRAYPAATLEDAALCYVQLLDDPTAKVCASPPLSAAERLRLGQLVLRLLVEEIRAPVAGERWASPRSGPPGP